MNLIALADQVRFGKAEAVYAFVVAYRLSVRGPEDLAKLLPVTYFAEGHGTPPNAPTYDSGHSVVDVLDGKAGWSREEIQEFRDWIASNENLDAWAKTEFAAIEEAIRSSPIWSSEFVTDEPEKGAPS